jgi:ADP-ribose pyrophosphatase YjhB (NUDIX family)
MFLLQRRSADPFWALPGGRVEHGELIADGLRREIAEEIGQPVAVGRLLVVVENLFQADGVLTHSIEFYFSASLPKDGRNEDPQPCEADLRYAWFDLGAEPDVDVRPTGIARLVTDPPADLAFLTAAALADLPVVMPGEDTPAPG